MRTRFFWPLLPLWFGVFQVSCKHSSADLSKDQSLLASDQATDAERNIKTLYNQLKMNQLHERRNDKREQERFRTFASTDRLQGAPTAWYYEELEDQELGKVTLVNFMKNLEAWVTRDKPVDKQDLGLNFVATNNNSLTTLSDKEQVWPALIEDLKSAKSSIHIILFGLMGDAWGREVFEILAQKVKEGVKVRVLADALGARDHAYFKYVNRPFLDEMRAKGIEILSTSTPIQEGLHFDHRKIYVVDGRLAYNTGYTVEEHMRKIHFDMAFRIEGDLVKQLQAQFFTSYFYFGGKLPVAEKDFSLFLNRYFPELPVRAEATQKARLLVNVPWVQHRSTETYYAKIRAAKKKVVAINEFMSEPKFLELLEAKAKEGVALTIIYPRLSEWSAHRYDAYHFFEKIKKYPNVKMYLFDGPMDTGWLHTKGIVIDDGYISFGSTNMDTLSLYHNFETNIESEDPRVIADIQSKIVDYSIRFSKPYELPEPLLEKFKTWTAPLVSVPLKYFFKVL